jgi:4-hydroxy-tetrahydrodipicolinate synthase
MKNPIKGVLSPVVTPFNPDLSPNAKRLGEHCNWLLANNVGLAVFGTNSEANSLSLSEKLYLLDYLVDHGIPADKIMPGTGCCALPETIELTKKAVALGCAGVLMLPPFYYKGISDQGLYRYYSEVIDAVASDDLRIYLYHIPPVAMVPVSYGLIELLIKRYPKIIAGIKDSSGDWANTYGMLNYFQSDNFDVFAGSESFLLATLQGGGAGCISAIANVNPGAIAKLADTWQSDTAEQQQQQLDAVRDKFKHYVMIAAMKAAIAHYSNTPDWAIVRPPLDPLDPSTLGNLITELESTGFSMPNLTEPKL